MCLYTTGADRLNQIFWEGCLYFLDLTPYMLCCSRPRFYDVPQPLCPSCYVRVSVFLKENSCEKFDFDDARLHPDCEAEDAWSVEHP